MAMAARAEEEASIVQGSDNGGGWLPDMTNFDVLYFGTILAGFIAHRLIAG